MDDLMAYMTTWVNELQAKGVATEARRQFGWTGEDFKSFVLGDKEIFGNIVGDNPPSTPTAGLFHAFEPRGSLQEWIDMANFYDRDGFELHQYIVGTGFGSPLMALSPVSCAGFHVHSKESGIGKTTAMYVGASVWGSPKALVLGEDDTQHSRMNRSEVYQNLPLYIDELTELEGKELSSLIYQISSGKQRNRMTSGGNNTERARGKPWKLMSVTTGNCSAIDKVSLYKTMPKAEAQRMMETKAVRLFDESKTKHLTDAHATNAETVYGHAGRIYIQYVIANISAVKELLAQVQAKIDKAANLTAENRFWSAGASADLTGILIAKKLGLLNYDTNKLFRFIVKLLKENKNSVEDMNSPAIETLNDYFHENWGSILKIKSTDDLRKGQKNGLDNLVIPELDPKVRLVGRYETDTKIAFLSPKPLRAWCGKQQLNYPSFKQELEDDFGAKIVKVRLTKGTNTRLDATWCLAIDCSRADVGENVDKDVEV
tara:strand:- start:40 stop:1500 length:1461 start_codon:yes stop_codon:yes gene_type:complete